MRPAESSDRMASYLVQTLTRTQSFNEFLENAIPMFVDLFGASRAILIDFRENTGCFDVLHFAGYPHHGRFELQRKLAEMDVRKALSNDAPYFSDDNPKRLYLPLYFATTLEALFVFESEQVIELTPVRKETARIVSKFIGLLMSSSRLSINQTGAVDFNDLQRAREIQLTYLPPDNLETDRYEVYGYNQSSAMVGGDYFDYFRLRENSIQVVLADASGHGLSAALIMSTFRALLHADIDEWKDCSQLFTALNRAVYSGTSVIQYLTSVFLDFNEQEARLRYTNAGHFEPALIRSDGLIERLRGGGPPMGMFGSSEYPEAEAAVGAGDLLVLFTDGFTDLRNTSDEYFGEERILSSVQQNRTRPLKEIASLLLNEGMSFSASPQPEDDLTLLFVRFR